MHRTPISISVPPSPPQPPCTAQEAPGPVPGAGGLEQGLSGAGAGAEPSVGVLALLLLLSGGEPGQGRVGSWVCKRSSDSARGSDPAGKGPGARVLPLALGLAVGSVTQAVSSAAACWAAPARDCWSWQAWTLLTGSASCIRQCHVPGAVPTGVLSQPILPAVLPAGVTAPGRRATLQGDAWGRPADQHHPWLRVSRSPGWGVLRAPVGTGQRQQWEGGLRARGSSWS